MCSVFGSTSLTRALRGKVGDRYRSAVGVVAITGAIIVVVAACLLVYVSDQGDITCPPQAHASLV